MLPKLEGNNMICLYRVKEFKDTVKYIGWNIVELRLQLINPKIVSAMFVCLRSQQSMMLPRN